VNSTAFARRAWDQARADRVKAAFKALFRSPDVPALLAIDRLRRQMPDAPEVIRLCDFVERMQLGVHGRHRELLRGQGSVGPRSGEIAPRPA
jgi:acyl-[acyl carrier protein]--UDP-N-acetylglucosamine O-acyltransferase